MHERVKSLAIVIVMDVNKINVMKNHLHIVAIALLLLSSKGRQCKTKSILVFHSIVSQLIILIYNLWYTPNLFPFVSIVIIVYGSSRNCTDGDVRLEGGRDMFEGHVEMCDEGE